MVLLSFSGCFYSYPSYDFDQQNFILGGIELRLTQSHIIHFISTGYIASTHNTHSSLTIDFGIMYLVTIFRLVQQCVCAVLNDI